MGNITQTLEKTDVQQTDVGFVSFNYSYCIRKPLHHKCTLSILKNSLRTY